MFVKVVILAFLALGVNCRYVLLDIKSPTYLIDGTDIEQQDLEDLYADQPIDSVQPGFRVRRQVQGVMNTNPDGTANVMAKLPLAGNDRNILSAIGGIEGAKPGGSFGAASAGLAFDNVNGHGASLTGKHIPNFGDQLTAAGKVGLFHNDHNDLSANAFATRTMPNNPLIPNFNTVGGGVDYMRDNKYGASLGVAHTPLFQKTDYSALGKLNLFHDRTSSLDFNAGATRSVSPFIPKSSWQPTAGFSFSKYF